MIFANQSLPIVHRYIGDGKDPRIEVCLGTNDKHGKPLSIEIPISFRNQKYFERGVHKNLTLDCTEPGRPRIIEKEEPYVCDENSDCYAIISTHRETTAYGNGRVYDGCEAGKKIEVIAIAIGSDSDIDGKLNWYDYVLKVPYRGEFYVQWSGFLLGHDCMTCWHLRDDSDDVISTRLVDSYFDNKPLPNTTSGASLPYLYDDRERMILRTCPVIRNAIMLEP